MSVDERRRAGRSRAALMEDVEAPQASDGAHAASTDDQPIGRARNAPPTPEGFLALRGWQQWPLSVVGLFHPRADTVFRAVVRRGRGVPASGERASFEDNIYPTIAQIAFDCMMPERTVRRTLADLKDWGMLTWQSGSSRRSNQYRVTMTEAEVLDIAIGTAVARLRRPTSSWMDICRLTKALLRLAHQASQCGEFMDKHHPAPADVPATRPPVATHVATDGHPRGHAWPPTRPPVADQEDPSADTSEIQKKQKPAASSADVVMNDAAGDGHIGADDLHESRSEALLAMLNTQFAVGRNSKTRLLATRFAAEGISAEVLAQELRSQVTSSSRSPGKSGVVVSVLEDPHTLQRCQERECQRRVELLEIEAQAQRAEATHTEQMLTSLRELEKTITDQCAEANRIVRILADAGATPEWSELIAAIIRSEEHRRYWQGENAGPEFEELFARLEQPAATGLAAVLIWESRPIDSTEVIDAVRQIRRKLRSSSANRPDVLVPDDAPRADAPTSTPVRVAQPTLPSTTP